MREEQFFEEFSKVSECASVFGGLALISSQYATNGE